MIKHTERPPKPKSGLKRKDPPNAPTPTAAYDRSDPGDATQRNFRYQHAFGVILLISGKLGLSPYVAIWCEQHEDFLAERIDRKFDAYQIKTSRPENGAWKLNDLGLIKTIGRFVDLVEEFGDAINKLFFVSNTECETVGKENTNDRLRALCPCLFLEHVQSCQTLADINSVFTPTFESLQATCGCEEDILFRALQKMDVILGPSRGEMDAALCQEHLANLDLCKSFNADKLKAFRDDLIGIVYRASSLQVEDPIRHLRPLINGETIDPRLEIKRLVIETTVVFSPETDGPKPFQFVGKSFIQLGEPRSPAVLEQKLTTGGLTDQIDYMAERERSAENHLLEDVQRRPERYPDLLKQIEQVVIGECREAHLRARRASPPYGPAMLIDVQDRLRRIAREEAPLVGDHGYECLIGMAAMLTRECVVWWSPRFQVQVGPS